MPALLTALRDQLIAQDIVRKPSVAGARPPLWLEPKFGTPAPGEGDNATEIGTDLVLAAFVTGGFAPEPYGSWQRRPIVDIQYRGVNAVTIEQTELAVTGALIDRRDWMMGGLHVIECQQWNALARVGSDPQGFMFRSSYWFQLTRA